jgi:hypothetical protein
MIGIWSSYSNAFLIVAGVAMLAAFGLPLMLVPMSWAEVFRWELPQPQSLTKFFGRSLGVFITIMAIFAFKVTQTPIAKPFFFDLMLWIFGGMILLHVYGAVRKSQPVIETVEIGLWVFLSVITLCFYPI